MDLKALSQAMQTEVDLIHPVTNKPTGIKIVLRSRHSAESKALANQRASVRMEMNRRNKHMSIEAIQEESLSFMVASVLSWTGVERDGKPLECTPDNVREILTDPSLEWIKEKLDEAFGNDALFFPG